MRGFLNANFGRGGHRKAAHGSVASFGEKSVLTCFNFQILSINGQTDHGSSLHFANFCYFCASLPMPSSVLLRTPNNTSFGQGETLSYD